MDAIAGSHTGCIFGMRLRIKGETELENVVKLFERFLTLQSVHDDVSIKFDCGYGKTKILLAVCTKGYNISSVANSVGSEHTFIAFNDGDEFIKKLDHDPMTDDKISLFCSFILTGSDLAGAQISSAQKQISLIEDDEGVQS